nr:AcvB/VirJ family lysyl-phosphatidylglycerol hydrolase [uncultured Arsenicibacter sp.]
MRNLLIPALVLTTLTVSRAQPVSQFTDSFGPFGRLTVYRPAVIESVVLFASGDGGWNKGVVDMAALFTRQHALVIGIDNVSYLNSLRKQKGTCVYPASDFENLSIYMQKKLRLPAYQKPVLVGYSSGATVIYGALAQAPKNTFKGAVALGFCPDLAINKPFCEGAGLTCKVLKPGKSYYLNAVPKLSAPFYAIVGQDDKVCDWKSVETFLAKMQHASLLAPVGVGHGFLNTSRWLGQLEQAFAQITRIPDRAGTQVRVQTRTPETRLPVTVTGKPGPGTKTLALIISGDGGWTSFDEDLAKGFAAGGIPSVGLDAQSYFWERKDPESTTRDLSLLLSEYLQEWQLNEIILVGYSFGADIIPFITNRLPLPLKEKVKGTLLLSPDRHADFEIHLSDMLNLSQDDPYDVLAEVKKIPAGKAICVFGQEEDTETIQAFRTAGVHVVLLPGGHHYQGDPALLAEKLIKAL